MVRNITLGSRTFDIVNLIVMGLLLISCLYPLWYTFCVSISEKSAANAGLVTLYPIGFSLSPYKEIMSDPLFFNAFWISIQRTVLGTSFSLLITVLMAYPLARPNREFKMRNTFMWILVFCMLFNGGLIPWYLTIQNYHLIDSIWALVLGGGVPVFDVILIMNFFRNLPKELNEAAVVDGAGPWAVLFRVYIPCSIPVLAAVALFLSVYHWNEFFNGLVLMNTAAKYPLQTYIQQLVVNIPVGTNLTPEQYKKLSELSNRTLNSAKVFIAMVPMLIVYPFLQKYFVSGIMLGAVKE
ncbi:multiple sugar transport system permease protein/putative aldouronate transport system permease protein [Paenibacillus phyllosphaerae]|uniref:Multiple sugar transport system permease protein/putative aldouronate transport system permease protein n=1 Tax=Paenibacillus phyllosphaerae TaxID=274593 RepID=A0A7W5B2U5_9BACL|nr:carbohydrate ABC transporter permease [Paenibacillus phyllosphaerae]MBB3113192.1 multiple sugar transport system permease protein/putative aldouronate transport system permease protein [Paenibacillus phyllosphaerae]